MQVKPTRREFLVTAGSASAALLLNDLHTVGAQIQAGSAPWFANCVRWGQTNLTLKDIATCDVAFWRDFWKQTSAQAVLVNGVAGFAAFPSRNPLLESSPFAPNRDLFGEINAAARAEGIYVLARMEANNVTERIRNAFADYRTVNENGQRGNMMCINSPFRQEHVYEVYREIMDRYKVAAFTDNSTLGASLCYCKYCTAKWAKEVGGELPRSTRMDDAQYRRWVRWNSQVVLDVWDEMQTFVKQIGGPDCLYISYVRMGGTNSRDIAARVPFLMMDCQSRNDSYSFSEHADEARYLRSLTEWEKNVTVCSAQYHHSHGYFRISSDPTVESRMYLKSGLAGGFDPWWHIVSSNPPDNRMFSIVPPVFRWHQKNEQYLTKGRPIATAGIIRSDDNAVFYGTGGGGGAVGAPGLAGFGGAGLAVQMPYRGMLRALFQSRIPYYPIHIKDLPKHTRDLKVLVFPNIGAMSDAECDEVREYVRGGGSILVTGVTSLYDQDGMARSDFGMTDVLGVSVAGRVPARDIYSAPSAESYLVFEESATQHPALASLSTTNAIAFGGPAIPLRAAPDRQILAYHAALSETGALVPDHDSPSVVVGEFGKGRVVYLAADLDRQYLREPNPDQASLLGGLLRWCARDVLPLHVEGDGYIGAYLNQQENRLVLHLFNGTGVDNGDDITDRFYPVGPLKIKVQAPSSIKGSARLLNAERPIATSRRRDFLEFEVPRVDDYEVVVLE